MRIAHESTSSKHRRIIASSTVIAGRYHIRQILGRGGMGLVYRAWDTKLLTTVVIKQLSLKAPNQHLPLPTSIALFQREAAMLDAFNHPSIPRLIDQCTNADGHFIIMEHVEGVRLDALLAYRGLPLHARSELAQQVCYLVEFLHRQPIPIIHCDLEVNHFIVRNRRVLLIDFGLARFVDDKTVDQLIIAKAWYSPPEQCTGGRLDQRTDIYALGQTLRLIFGGFARMKGLSEVLERATNPFPHQRYQSVTDLRVSLLASVEALAARSQVSEYTPSRRLQRRTANDQNEHVLSARSQSASNWNLPSIARSNGESTIVPTWLLWMLMAIIAALLCSMVLFSGRMIKPLPLRQTSLHTASKIQENVSTWPMLRYRMGK